MARLSDRMRATKTGGSGQVGQPFKGASSLAELLSGAKKYAANGGRGGPVTAKAPATTQTGTEYGTNAKGEKFSKVEVDGRKFHVYFSGTGQRMVREIKKPKAAGPTFTPAG